MWIQPIVDRTAQDIAKRTPKAYCNAADLQRLEDDCAVLAGLLGVVISTRTWTRTDFPTVSELARMRGNIAALRAAYYTRTDTPATPEDPLNHWEKWNAAEQILLDLYTLYTANLDAAAYAGEGRAGDELGVM